MSDSVRMRDIQKGDQLMIDGVLYEHTGFVNNKMLGPCKRFTDANEQGRLFSHRMLDTQLPKISDHRYEWPAPKPLETDEAKDSTP